MEEVAGKKVVVGGINLIGEDTLEEILSRLPASSFASATCVNRSWSHLCNRILTKPKLVSALSLNPNLNVAVSEVVEKVLAQPIRPHFAIASIGSKFSLPATRKLIASRLGTGIPIIVSEAYGIIGKDVLTGHHKEVNWLETDVDETGKNCAGIVLTVGFLPGLKVCSIPLMKTVEGPSQQSTIDKFVTDIKDYTASVSDCNSPVGIILFADRNADMGAVLEKMDCAMSKETIIIGDESNCFLWNDGEGFKEDAIALVFATDRDKPGGIGEVHFSLALSTGVSPVGPVYKAASVRVVKDEEGICYTWLTARRKGSLEKLDGQVILEEIDDMYLRLIELVKGLTVTRNMESFSHHLQNF
ncbi:hypothetical protein IFM89_000552 [Coptis chinensis]|uniref:F-box domain-containing protein n=1 Tax=Coptis chinensis TaxID=261450 RepID=A0A835IJ59_9MAGN|nr:hypothetical protein IFM89_000552 [Coptis chinensis]